MEHGKLSGLEKNVAFLKEAQFWNADKIQEFQEKAFQTVLHAAYENSPFYKDLYDKNNINISDIKSLKDLSKLPMVDKEMMRHVDFSYLQNREDIGYMTTGGSTGNPFKIYMDEEFRAKNHANTYFYLSIAGFEIPTSRNVRLHGDLFADEEIQAGKFWRIQNDRTLVLASNHISRETVPLFVEQINAFKPDYIHAFPSALSLFVKIYKEMNLKLEVNVEALFFDCECLYDTQKEEFKKIFKGKVYNIYGHTEGSVFGINCPESELIHINPFIGHLEIVNANGEPVTKDGEKGEVVVTGFNNKIMPFIRFKTGDIAINSTESCSCERHWKLIQNVEGRKQDYVIDKNKVILPLAPTLFDYNIDWSGVEKFQVVQNEIGVMNFNMLVDSSANKEKISQYVQQELDRYFGSAFDIHVKVVNEIPYTVRGKYRYLVQQLDFDNYWD